MNEIDNLKNKLKVIKFHMCWGIGVLITIVCGLIAALICDFEDSTILNFASSFSTLLSIVLSIIAIFYTFLAGIESQRINEKTENGIQHINNKIEILSEKMQTTYSLISDLDDHISLTINSIESMKSPVKTENDTIIDNQQKELVDNLKGLKMQLHGIAATFNTNLK